MPKRIFNIALILFSFLLFNQCKNSSKTGSRDKLSKENEILIYCENSMVAPLLEIKTRFEKEKKCQVRIQNDCSKNLIALINYTQKGDLFIPSSKGALKTLRAQAAITDTFFIGYNELVFMVKKNNPLQFDGTLEGLLNSKHALIIGNPETSSLGYETKMLFNSSDYETLIKNVVALSTDSKGLIKSLKNNEADIVINWKNTIYEANVIDEVEIIKINSDVTATKEIYGGLLKYSDHPQLAEEFMALTLSDYGYSVFKRYGISKRKMFIF